MKKPIRKIVSAVMGTVIVFAFAASGCSGKNNHVHDWSEEWSTDTENHWHTCSGCKEVKDLAPHTFSEGRCTVCGELSLDYDGDFTSTPLPSENKIYVVGDSTVSSFDDFYYMPRYGYGTQIAEYFNVTADQVVNLALSGRSSLSFLSEANYTTLKNNISEGDYLIIGFGHNDEKDDDATRYTNPSKSYTDDSTADGPSFQYTLYENYVKLAKDAGATPILCTPIVRYSSTADYSGSKIHITDKGDYTQAIKTLGEQTDTTVIDLTSITKSLYEADNDAAAYFHAHTSYDGVNPNETPAGRDDTHINKYGAQMVVYQLAKALRQTNNPLAAHVKSDISAPTDWKIAVNDAYVKSDYTAPDLSAQTAIATIAGTNSQTQEAYSTQWYKSTFGDIGGDNKVSNFSVSYADNTFTVSNPGGVNGKFTDATDGLTTAFMRVSKDDNFSISVDAKIVSLGDSAASEQAGFGLMLRDDMYINQNSKMIQSNFVAAGILANGTTIFSRSSRDKLTKSNNKVTPTEGATYNLTITRLGQVVTVTVKDGDKTYEQTYTDFDFTAVDNDYMYLCLFANRNLTVEYSNIVYSYDGVAQGA